MKLPARFEDDRIFLHPVTTEGIALTFCTDTGGAAPRILRSTVARLGLTPFKRRRGDEEYEFICPPPLRGDAALPMGVDFDALIVAYDVFGDGDGFLGMQGFADRVCRFSWTATSQARTGRNKNMPVTWDSRMPWTVADWLHSRGSPPKSTGRAYSSQFLFDTGARCA